MSEVEVMDARGQCCLATAGVNGRLEGLESGEILEVVLNEGMHDALTKLAEEQGCEILETNKEDKAVRVKLQKKAPAMIKIDPLADYPPEEGCYLQGNHYSPSAVVVTLNAPYGTSPTEVESIPSDIDKLVKVAIETGAALSGTLQTENIGIEKIVCNVVANPNIRYLVLCGKEVQGHNSGSALRALLENGIDEKRTIVGSQALTPYLFNIPLEAIKRFREQLTLVDLLGEMDPEVIRKAVWSCFQEPEKPVQFKNYTLYDPGAYPEPALSCRLTGMVKHPEETEEWELDEVVKRIEEGKALEERPQPKTKPVKVSEKKKEGVSESTVLAFIGKRLLRIAEELADIAELCGAEKEKPIGQAKVEERTIEAEARPAVTEEVKAPIEEDPFALLVSNKLRAYNGMFAAFEACIDDMCNNGCTFPSVVITIGKKLKKLNKDLENSSLPVERKQVLETKIEGYLEMLKAFPQDTDRPCQKSAGNCTIGSGCFVKAAVDFVKLVAEPSA